MFKVFRILIGDIGGRVAAVLLQRLLCVEGAVALLAVVCDSVARRVAAMLLQRLLL